MTGIPDGLIVAVRSLFPLPGVDVFWMAGGGVMFRADAVMPDNAGLGRGPMAL